MRVDRALVGLDRDAVDGVQELRAGEDPAGLPDERGEELELGRRELDGLAQDRHPHAPHVDLDVAGTKDVGTVRSCGFAAAEHGADARDQFFRAERLDDVVVGAQLEPDDAVGLVRPRGEHDDGNG